MIRPIMVGVFIGWLAVLLAGPLAALAANPDLAVTKGVNNPTPLEGQSVIFTVTVENLEDEPGENITINDLVPAGLTFVIATFVDGSYNAGTGNWNPPDLEFSDTATLIFIATVDEGTAGTCITNTATVTAVTPADTNAANDSASAVVCIPVGDVGVFKSVDIPAPAEGNIVEFLVEVVHFGGSPVRDLVIEDDLPAGFIYVYHVVDDPSNANYSPGLGEWTLNVLGVTSTATLRIGARVDTGTAGTCITNRAQLTEIQTADANPANDEDEAVVCPTATPAFIADMRIPFTSFPTDAVQGKKLSGGIFIENNGPNTAKNVRVIICLPEGFELDEDLAPPNMTQSGDKVIIDFGDMDPFTSTFVFVPVRVTPNAPTGITHITFEVTSGNPDDNMGNNTQTIFIDVLSMPPGGETVDQSGSDGDPVNTYHGELYETQRPDLALGGPMPLFLQRYYASRMQQEGHVISRLGHNWQHNFDITLQHTSPSNITVAFKRGRILFFDQSGTNWNLTRHLTVPFRLREEVDGFRLGDPRSHFTYTFDTNGLLTKIEDNKGNAHTLTYGSPLLTNVTDGLGRNLTFFYDPDGLLTNVTDGIRSVGYSYVNSNLTAFTDALGNVTQYEYSSDTNFPGLLTRKVLPEGNAPFTQAFDELSRVLAQADARSFTSRFEYVGNNTFITDPLNFQQRHTHSDLGLLNTIQDEAGRNMTFIYFTIFPNDQGRVGRIRDRHTNDWNIFYGNNDHGKPTRFQYPNLANHRIGYAPRATNGFNFFEVAAITNFDARVERFQLDAFGNRVAWTDRAAQVWTYGYNERSQMTGATNPLGGTANFTYDAFGNRVTATDSDTGVWDFEYDALHRLVKITHPNSDTVEFTYDALNRLTSLTDERVNTTTFEYDANSRLTRIEDAVGNDRLFEYDEDNRLIRDVDRLGNAAGYGYDPRGLLNTVTNPNGNVTRFQYSSTRFLTGVIDPLGQTNLLGRNNEGVLTSFSNPLGETWLYRVDQLGYATNLITPLGHTSVIRYDNMRRVTNIVNAVGQVNRFEYDQRGGLTNVLHPMGIQGRYRRNAIGRVDRITDPRGGDWDFTYTPAGRRTSMLDPLSRTNLYEYDTRGRWIRTVLQNGTSVSNTLDGAGNVVQREYSTGPAFEYAYDALNRPTNATGVALTYDAEGRIVRSIQNGITLEAVRDPGGRVTSLSYDGEFEVYYTYDALDRLVRVSDTLSGGGMSFTYDAASRLTGVTRSNGVNGAYQYDASGRRTRIAEGPAGSLIDLHYAYDAQGRITEIDFVNVPLDPAGLVTNLNINLAYDLASQITTFNYQYDRSGRLTNSPSGAFSWDGASRLVQASNVTYAYNGLHDLVTRTQSGATTRYYYLHVVGLRPPAAERNEGTGDFIRFYVWSPGGLLLYGIDAATSNAFYYHFDQSGNTLAITGPGGTLTESYAYDPYGNLLGRTGASGQPFEFNGAFGVRREPAVAGLHHMRARWYHARSGRFISKEPIWPVLANARQLNPYQFALQDPLRFVDPEGTDPSPTDIELSMMTAQLFDTPNTLLRHRWGDRNKVKNFRHVEKQYERSRAVFTPDDLTIAYLIARPFNAPEAPDWPIEFNTDEWYEEPSPQGARPPPSPVKLDFNVFSSGHGHDDVWMGLDIRPPVDMGPSRTLRIPHSRSTPSPVVAPPQTPPPEPPDKPKLRLTLVYSAQTSDAPWGGGYYYTPTPAPAADVPGDFNGDGAVDAADYVEWRKNPGAFGGGAGYDQWRSNFGYGQ